MVTHLLESGTRRRRSFTAAIPSIALHSALILGAIHATAHAALRGTEPPRMIPIPLALPEAPTRRVHANPARNANAPDRGTIEARSMAPLLPALSFAIDSREGHAPPIVSTRDFGNGVSERHGITGDGLASIDVLSAEQVDRQAAPLAGTLAPSYPEALRVSGAQGTVVAQFVVDSTGRVEAGSFRTVGSVNSLFSAAVESALFRARFRPAELKGTPVRQLVQQSFSFELQ